VIYYTAPGTETIVLAPAQVVSLSRSYLPDPGALQVVTLAPGSQWQVYPQGGTRTGVWHNSGDIVPNLPIGNYVVEYNTVPNYVSPPTETVTVLSAQTVLVNRPYTANPGQLKITLTPSTGQWRVDNGAWQLSGATVSNVAVGSHTVDYYGPITDYTPPVSETVTVSSGQLTALTRFYHYINPATISVTLTPSFAQWRINGGQWMNSGTSTNTFRGPNTVEYSDVVGYITPPSETVTLIGGINPTVNLYPARDVRRLAHSEFRAMANRRRGLDELRFILQQPPARQPHHRLFSRRRIYHAAVRNRPSASS
jgi:hypothetical protein